MHQARRLHHRADAWQHPLPRIPLLPARLDGLDDRLTDELVKLLDVLELRGTGHLVPQVDQHLGARQAVGESRHVLGLRGLPLVVLAVSSELTDQGVDLGGFEALDLLRHSVEVVEHVLSGHLVLPVLGELDQRASAEQPLGARQRRQLGPFGFDARPADGGAALQQPAQQRERHVGEARQHRAVAGDQAVPGGAEAVRVGGDFRQAGAAQAVHHAAADVAQGMAGVLEEQLFEVLEAALLVLVLDRLQRARDVGEVEPDRVAQPRVVGGRARQRQIGNVCRAAAARVRGRARVGWSRSAFDPEDALQHGDENPTIREWRGRKPIDEHPNVIVRATHRPTQQCRLPGRAGQRVAPRCDRLDEAREPSVDLLALELAALALLFEARPRRRNVDEHGLREKI